MDFKECRVWLDFGQDLYEEYQVDFDECRVWLDFGQDVQEEMQGAKHQLTGQV